VTENICPYCGAKTRMRLGASECLSCNWIEQPAEPAIPFAMQSTRPSTDPPIVAGSSKQQLPMPVERWLLCSAGLAIYIAGSTAAWLIVSLSHGFGEQGAVVLIWLWPWMLTWILASLLSHAGIVLSVLLVAALQALVLFTTSIQARYAALAFLAASTLWFALFLVPLTYKISAGRWFWILLVPVAAGVWGIVFLIRDIRWLRRQTEQAGFAR